MNSRKVVFGMGALLLVAVSALLPFHFASGQSSNGNHGASISGGACSAAGNTYFAAAGSTLSCDTSITDNGSGTLTASQFVSNVATGTAPFTVSSTTNVVNLNASSLSGKTFANPGVLGSTTPGGVIGTSLQSRGTTFTTNAGCGEGTLTGGAAAGKITTAGQTSCTDIITIGAGATAPTNGYQCTFTDLTTAADAANPHQTATTTTTVTWVSGTIVAGDVISFACIGY